MAEDCREHGANHGIIGVHTELEPIGDPSGLRCLCIVLGFEFTLGTPNRKASWLVCVGLQWLPSRSESWELIPHGGHPRATMTEAVPSIRLARFLDRHVDHDNPDGGSGCHRQHRHPQFAVPHSLRQPPAGPHRHGPAGATRFLWHALRVDHETRYRRWPAHRDRYAAKSDLLTGAGLERVRLVSCPLDMQEITITKIYSKFQGQLSFGVRYV